MPGAASQGWPRRADVGREARRRRTRIQTIALALIPLMAIGPEAALAINNEALLYQAVAAAAAGQTGQYETTYTYDANGNMVTRTVINGGPPATDTYIYDAQNRLVAAELTVDETAYVSYGYDADGIRNRVTKNGVTTWHLTDPNRDYAQVLAEHNGSGEVYVRYCYGDDLISQTRDPSGSSPATRFYHYDGQLSTRQLTEGTPGDAGLGVVKDTYTFDAFGNLLDKTGLTANEYLYTGEQYDPNVRFYYLRARYYAQDVGRFTARDPFEGFDHDPASLHKYTYAHSNPVDNVDPSGMFTFGEIAVVSAIVGVLAGLITYKITGSVKAAIVVGVLAALVTAAIMVCITYWPQIVNWVKGVLRYQQAHRTVSDRLYRKLVEECGDNVALRVNFFNRIPGWRLWLQEFPKGVVQQLFKLFRSPKAFLHWLNPTPAGWVGLSVVIAGGAAAVLWYLYRDDLTALFEDIRS